MGEASYPWVWMEIIFWVGVTHTYLFLDLFHTCKTAPLTHFLSFLIHQHRKLSPPSRSSPSFAATMSCRTLRLAAAARPPYATVPAPGPRGRQGQGLPLRRRAEPAGVLRRWFPVWRCHRGGSGRPGRGTAEGVSDDETAAGIGGGREEEVPLPQEGQRSNERGV